MLVAVHHAAHHHAAQFAAVLGQVAHLRHEDAQEEHIAHEPQRRGNRQPPVGQAHEHQGTQAVDHDVPDRADAGHHALAHGVAGLHDAVGDAPGKVVLKKRPALAHHVPVALPADQAGHARHHGVVAYQAVHQQRQRPAYQHQQRHAHQHRQGVGQRGASVGGLHQAHQAADEHGDQRVDQRHHQAGDEHRAEQALGLAHVMPVEGHQRLRWRRARARGGADQVFEDRKHQWQRLSAALGAADGGRGGGGWGIVAAGPTRHRHPTQ